MRVLGTVVLVCASSWWVFPGSAQTDDAMPRSAAAILKRALAPHDVVSSRQIMDITIRNEVGEEQKRRLAVAAKLIDGRLHSIGRFIEPEYLRGTTILNIENPDRADDHFLYLRTLERIRRVSMSQRADAFMGTDLTYQDFERRTVDDFVLELRPASRVQGEAVSVVSGRPRFQAAYDRIEFFVAEEDGWILEARYFKGDADQPYKVLHAPRKGMQRFGTHMIPTHLIVENRSRRTETTVRIHDLTINPELADHLFTASSLEVGRPIPGLE